jgi:hypothetical protein
VDYFLAPTQASRIQAVSLLEALMACCLRGTAMAVYGWFTEASIPEAEALWDELNG